jgi:phosphopantetheinyl transferase
MLPAAPSDKLTFDSAPLNFLDQCKDVFFDSTISIAILSLNSLDHLRTKPQHTWLQEKELIQFKSFSLEKRSREWLGGRICAKKSANTFFRSLQNQALIPQHSKYQVQSEESGRPYFSTTKGLDLTFPELSISHSKAYAAAMSSLEHCGIDIQYSAKTLGRVQEKFCTPIEDHILKETLPEISTIARLTQLWSGKEAAKKMLSPGGIPGFHELELLELNKSAHRINTLTFSEPNGPFLVQVVTSMFNEEYALAVCCARSKKEVH